MRVDREFHHRVGVVCVWGAGGVCGDGSGGGGSDGVFCFDAEERKLKLANTKASIRTLNDELIDGVGKTYAVY